MNVLSVFINQKFTSPLFSFKNTIKLTLSYSKTIFLPFHEHETFLIQSQLFKMIICQAPILDLPATLKSLPKALATYMRTIGPIQCY